MGPKRRIKNIMLLTRLSRFVGLMSPVSLLVAIGCTGANFKGEGKQASLPPPKCPGGVEEVSVSLPADLANCWSSGRLIDTKGIKCSNIQMIKTGCESLAAATALAQSKGYAEPDETIQQKINEGGIIIGCGEWKGLGVFYIQMDTQPLIENECKKTIGKKLFSYCIYSADSSYTGDTSRCTWPDSAAGN